MKKNHLEYSNSIFVLLIVCVVSLLSCNENNSKEKAPSPVMERPSDFASDEDFLDFIQKTHLNYMWEGAEKTSGLAPERIHMDGIYPQNDADVVTTGGSGFGIAGLIVGIERGFISRSEGVVRFHQIVDYLANADRFHGAWPHWIYGPTGKVKPFGTKDNGGDLVETAFLIEGLLCAREYFKNGNEEERRLAQKSTHYGVRSNGTGISTVKMCCIGIGAPNISGK